MAIDFAVDLDCIPKQTFGTQVIIDRLKGRTRAQAVIKLFRQNGDNRPPSEMGFEFTRNTAEGEEETRVIVVQDMLDEAAELDQVAHHCQNCPVNVRKQPFGCIGHIQYPISAAAEVWLLKQLPNPEQPLPWLLLRQTVTEMGYTGASVEPLRQQDLYFESRAMYARGLGEYQVTTNQVFEMLFLLGDIQPAQAGALLLFFGGVSRETEATQVTEVLTRPYSPHEMRERFPFMIAEDVIDDAITADMKTFFHALYYAWSENVLLLLDV